jgi:hypothetical protein
MKQNLDPLREARQRGWHHLEEMLATDGSLLFDDEVAQRLGVSVIEVERLREDQQLFALPQDPHVWRYPLWQIVNGVPLPGLDCVLTQLQNTSRFGVLRFFLTQSPALEGQRPLDALLSGCVESVLAVAKAHDQQGSA